MLCSVNHSLAAQANFIRSRLPAGGLFAGREFRISPEPFRLASELAKELNSLGRVLLQFYRAVNLLYRQSVAGQQPAWIANWLDQGKPADLVEFQRLPVFKNDLPCVIRPDILLTDSGFSITELDSVPGGIGLTGWLNQTYADLAAPASNDQDRPPGPSAMLNTAHESPLPYRPSPIAHRPSSILGGPDGMLRGFQSIFGGAAKVHIVVSDEASSYRSEMEWLAGQFGNLPFAIRDSQFTGVSSGDAVYRFFELFDLANVENAKAIFELAREKQIRLTPPPKMFFEEKMLFALLWNQNLRGLWRRELGEGFFERLLKLVPYTWLVDPTPLPPHGAIPELNLTDWHQLKTLSQRERELILKVSGFSDTAWGARGVYLGSDLSLSEWTEAVDHALRSFSQSPFVLQRYHKPRTVEASWFDFASNKLVEMRGRVRLCPYYFVSGDGDNARATLGGVLATICPADKKIIHGMKDAILAPCAA